MATARVPTNIGANLLKDTYTVLGSEVAGDVLVDFPITMSAMLPYGGFVLSADAAMTATVKITKVGLDGVETDLKTGIAVSTSETPVLPAGTVLKPGEKLRLVAEVGLTAEAGKTITIVVHPITVFEE